MEGMKEFVEFITRDLVDEPGKISLDCEEQESRMAFRLKVGPEGVGKVIGKNGRTAQATRVLLGAVAARQGKRAILEIIE